MSPLTDPMSFLRGILSRLKGEEKTLRRGLTIFQLEALRMRWPCVLLACRPSSFRQPSSHSHGGTHENVHPSAPRPAPVSGANRNPEHPGRSGTDCLPRALLV